MSEERTEIVVVDAVEGISMIPISELKRLTAYVNEVKKTLMIKGKDYIVEGNRQYTARSGFAKLAQGFRLSDDPPIIKTLYYDDPQTFEFDHYIRRVKKHEIVTTKIRGFEAIVKVIQVDTGRYASGEGACTVEELHMTNNMSPKWYHRCLGTAKTRAWNRAVSNFVGSADVSAEEMGFVYDEDPSLDRKPVDSNQDTGYELPEKYGPPEWNITDSVKSEGEGWDNIDSIIQGWIADTGLDIQVFHHPEHDAAKAWVKPKAFLGSSFGPICELFEMGKLHWHTNEGRWRFNRPEGV